MWNVSNKDLMGSITLSLFLARNGTGTELKIRCERVADVQETTTPIVDITLTVPIQ